jgi:acetolactate synthase I/II/III large subunit
MSVDRRDFLKVAASSATAFAGAVAPSAAQAPAPQTTDEAEVLSADHTGSDLMVDALKTLDLEYAAAVPGSSFRGIHESCVNYGGNKKPEWLTVLHEELSVALAHGYAKIEGKPMLTCMHGTVGLHHATMAIYNAYCDRTPVFMIVGNHMDGTDRRPGTGDWVHSVQDPAHLCRDFTKFDDQPVCLTSFAESAVRAYKLAMTPPMGPVLLSADLKLQESIVTPATQCRIPKLTLSKPPVGDIGSVREAAKLLVQADSPVIVADYATRTPAGLPLVVELAELLQAAVVDRGFRVNFPSRHPLNQSGRARAVVSSADAILGLDLYDFWGVVNSFRDQLHRTSQQLTKAGTKMISINSADLFIKANYQNFSRYTEVDLSIAADSEATLPSLIEEVKRLITADRRRVYEQRGTKLGAAHNEVVERVRAEATSGWNVSPVSTARMAAEVYAQIKDKDWSLVDGRNQWVERLWKIDKHYHHIGESGGMGLGYGTPASVGAALANRKHGRFSVAIQSDGDMMMGPGSLWTAAHHRIPILFVMFNNRAYHRQTQHILRAGLRHGRGTSDSSKIGTAIDDPNIDFAMLARSMGVHGEGPIENPNDLAPALRRAIATVEKGEPAVVDVVTQPR